MNLTTEPWIPVLGLDGRRTVLSLCDVFDRANEIRDLAMTPLERIATMRLLVCIAQAALGGPEDEIAWASCEPLIQVRAREYLAQWCATFELFGIGTRFLQLPNLQTGKATDEGNSASKLDLALATGNNATIFDNAAGAPRPVAPPRAAMNLLTFQCFSPGGRIGVAQWNGAVTVGNGSSKHAPCTPSSMVHALVVGATLLDTIRRNLLTREIVEDVYGVGGWGKPIWECPVAEASDTSAIKNATMTYLGRLVPLSRAVQLAEDGVFIVLANGLEYPIYPAFREATATIVRRKDDELAVLPASTSRSLWRQLAAVSVSRRTKSDPACGPLALSHAPALTTSLWVGALITDNAKIDEVVESFYALPARMFDAVGRAAYEAGILFAEQREDALMQAVKKYAESLNLIGRSAAYEHHARREYWTSVEQQLMSLFELVTSVDLVADLPHAAWGVAVHAAARAAFERSCPRQTPRQLEAFALGLRKLNFAPHSVHSTPTTHE